MTVAAAVHGVVGEGFGPVQERFADLVASGAETGAGLSVWVDGEAVVQLAGGWSDVARSRRWESSTLVHTYSVSKPFAALAALTAVRDQLIGLDDPMSQVWPDYAAHGKGETTLRHVLSHTAGQPSFPPASATTDILDDAALRVLLADAAPEHPPGSTIAEHALTYGHLLDGILRAAGAGTLADRFGVVASELGIDGFFGVPDSQLQRVAELQESRPGWAEAYLASKPQHVRDALARPPGAFDTAVLNSHAWRQSCFGAINLHVTAHAVGTFYADLLRPDGRVATLLGAELHEQVLTPQAQGPDLVVGSDVSWGLGPQVDLVDGRVDEVGMGGTGGSAGWVSATEGYACAYLTRNLGDFERVDAIEAAIKQCR